MIEASKLPARAILVITLAGANTPSKAAEEGRRRIPGARCSLDTIAADILP